jgi:hypothetical protein
MDDRASLWAEYVGNASGSAAIRAKLLKKFLVPVRRKRRFELGLVDPTAPGHPFELDYFRDFHQRTLRPFLESVARCRVFQSDDSQYPNWHRDRIDSRLKKVGARPADWRAAYVTRDAGVELLRLTPEVLDDTLFWWWAITQPPSVEIVFLVPLAGFDWKEFFQRSYDPQQVGGSQSSVLRVAKQETAKNQMVAFRIKNDLTASVVASGPNAEKLFQLAVEQAVLTHKLGVV